MGDRLFFALVAFAALAMIALALVWPQGLGRPSPAPFGHPAANSGPVDPATTRPSRQ